MKFHIISGSLLILLALNVGSAESLENTLIEMEKKSWDAWKSRDGGYFESFLTPDHLEVGFGGVGDKKLVVKSVASPNCVVRDFKLDKFKVTRVSDDVAVLNYYADQDTLCMGNPVPHPVWATSVYVRRDGRWQNFLYQQTQTRPPAAKAAGGS